MSIRPFSFSVQPHKGFCVVAFPKEIGKAGMADLHSATSDVIKEINVSKTAACVVDLSALNYMGSSVVACVVRIWKAIKAHSGTIVVVAPSEGIKDVLSVTGLLSIWTIVDTLEAGIHSLGFSIEAKVAKRERRLLIFVGPITLICGAVAVAVRLLPQLASLAGQATWFVYSIAGLSIVASGISSIRETGWRRLFSAIVLVLGLALMGSYIALNKPNIIEKKISTSPSRETAITDRNTDAENTKASTDPTANNVSEDPDSEGVRSPEGQGGTRNDNVPPTDVPPTDVKSEDVKSEEVKTSDFRREVVGHSTNHFRGAPNTWTRLI